MGLLQEEKAIKQVARMHFKKTGQTYVACEQMDFLWSKEEVFDFECMWHEGRTLDEMARYFKRTQEEILLLAVDRGTKGKIKQRKGGIIGVLNR